MTDSYELGNLFVARRGVDVDYPNGVPFNNSTAAVRYHRDADTIFDALSDIARGTCNGTSCRGDTARYDITLATERGHLVLSRLIVHRDSAAEARVLKKTADPCEP